MILIGILELLQMMMMIVDNDNDIHLFIARYCVPIGDRRGLQNVKSLLNIQGGNS